MLALVLYGIGMALLVARVAGAAPGFARLWALGTGAVWLSCGAQAALAAGRRRGLRARRRLARAAGARRPRRRRARPRAAGRARRPRARALAAHRRTTPPAPRRDRVAAPPALADGCERRPAAPHARPRAAGRRVAPRAAPPIPLFERFLMSHAPRRLLAALGASAVLVAAGVAVSASGGTKPATARPARERDVPRHPRARRRARRPEGPAHADRVRRPPVPDLRRGVEADAAVAGRALRPPGQGEARAAHAALHRPGLRARRARGRGRRAARAACGRSWRRSTPPRARRTRAT